MLISLLDSLQNRTDKTVYQIHIYNCTYQCLNLYFNQVVNIDRYLYFHLCFERKTVYQKNATNQMNKSMYIQTHISALNMIFSLHVHMFGQKKNMDNIYKCLSKSYFKRKRNSMKDVDCVSNINIIMVSRLFRFNTFSDKNGE